MVDTWFVSGSVKMCFVEFGITDGCTIHNNQDKNVFLLIPGVSNSIKVFRNVFEIIQDHDFRFGVSHTGV